MAGPGRAEGDDEGASRMRLDKWLWAARFFKTRQLATDAINGGKVHLNGQRVKPGRDVSVGARLEISKDQLSWDVKVLALATQRRPAKEACLLYEESPESLEKRLAELDRRRKDKEYNILPEGRPDKKGRREIHRFKRAVLGD